MEGAGRGDMLIRLGRAGVRISLTKISLGPWGMVLPWHGNGDRIVSHPSDGVPLIQHVT